MTRCALLAGWTDSGAKDVKHQRWFKNHVRRIEMADEAERVLGDMLKISTSAIKTKDGEEYTATEPALVKIKQDTAKFITSTLLKDTYSTKNENKVSVIISPNLVPVQLQATHIAITEVPLHQQVLPIHTAILSG